MKPSGGSGMRGRGIGRRIELGAGLAAAVLAPLGLALLLFAPLLAFCAVAARTCPPGAVRYEPLLRVRLSGPAWAAVLAPCAVALAGAAGAVADARFGRRGGRAVLVAATALGLLVCVLGTLGLVYLPAILALGLATHGAVLGRWGPGARMARPGAAEGKPSDREEGSAPAAPE